MAVTASARPARAAPISWNDIDVQLLVGVVAAQRLKVLVMLQILCLKTVIGLAKWFSRMALMKPIWAVQGVQKSKIVGKIGKP